MAKWYTSCFARKSAEYLDSKLHYLKDFERSYEICIRCGKNIEDVFPYVSRSTAIRNAKEAIKLANDIVRELKKVLKYLEELENEAS